jgi:hypothetical protein
LGLAPHWHATTGAGEFILQQSYLRKSTLAEAQRHYSLHQLLATANFVGVVSALPCTFGMAKVSGLITIRSSFFTRFLIHAQNISSSFFGNGLSG